jgi:predicted nucleic acid-binding protein
MDNAKRDKKYLGIDTNVLVAFLDKEHPDNPKTKMLVEHRHHAVNPTIIHEACHTLVYKQKWEREDAENVLCGYLDLDTTLFLSQTKQTTKLGLRLGTTYELGGRDALIIANFISNSIEKMVTFDKEILRIKKVTLEGKELEILLPDKG